MKQCPKCDYVRTWKDDHVSHEICPSCGIAYNKWLLLQETKLAGGKGQDKDDTAGFRETVVDVLLSDPERVPADVLLGRGIVYFVFLLWGLSFIFSGIDWVKIGGSFMHNINLPFHEFGHVLFGPFGTFMMFLGGSLFQVVLPLIVLGAFIKKKDNFAASIMLWWGGQNFIDISPYIADAKSRALPLVFGAGEAAHDWGNLLSMMGVVDSARFLAVTSFGIGAVLMTGSFIWGGYILNKQRQNVNV